MRICLFLLAVAAATGVGCNSIRSTPLSRTEDDHIGKDTRCCIHGIPVMVKIPTHLDVVVSEVAYYRYDTTTNDLVPIKTDGHTREASATIQMTEKMFVIDPMKPGAGTENYGFTFKSGMTNPKAADDGHGYLHDLTYRVDDTTITTGASLLATVIPLLGRQQDTSAASKDDVVKTRRTVAFGRFDINSPCFEAEVAAFLDQYLNNCHRCNGTIAPVPDAPKPVSSMPSGLRDRPQLGFEAAESSVALRNGGSLVGFVLN